MVNDPNRSRVSTIDMLRIRFRLHGETSDTKATIKWPSGMTLRQAITPLCLELGVSADNAKASVITRPIADSHVTYVNLDIEAVQMKMIFRTETISGHVMRDLNLLDA